MIKEIYIKNFALIDELRVQWDRGLTVLTGETGSGKSIIIDALSMCFGRRADNDFIRRGKEKSIIEICLTSLPERTVRELEEVGISCEGELIITRELHKDNSSVARLNGRIVPVSTLKKISPDLITIHGQNEYESLIQSNRQIRLLDNYGKHSILEYRHSYEETYLSYMNLVEEIKRIRENKDVPQLEREMDLLNYQLSEIENVKLKEGEFEELEEQRKLQVNAEKIQLKIQTVHSLLYEESNNVLSSLDRAVSSLQEISSYDSKFSDWAKVLSDSYYAVDDIVSEVRGAKDAFLYDENRLDEIFLRLDEIKKIHRKYGGTYSEVMAYRDEIKNRLHEYRERDKILETYRIQQETLEKELEQKANRLSLVRKQVAEELERLILEELDSLSLKNVQFRIDFQRGEYSRLGRDEVLFLISFNAGEELKAFHKVASGGEVSRFMLALQNVLSTSDEIDTLIFDEIDTGVSGIAAGKIGEKLSDISNAKQVLCITHLPQIASFGKEHFLIEKMQVEDKVITRLEHLDREQRIRELAKMAVGEEITETALCNAAELLEKNSKKD